MQTRSLSTKKTAYILTCAFRSALSSLAAMSSWARAACSILAWDETPLLSSAFLPPPLQIRTEEVSSTSTMDRRAEARADLRAEMWSRRRSSSDLVKSTEEDDRGGTAEEEAVEAVVLVELK